MASSRNISEIVFLLALLLIIVITLIVIGGNSEVPSMPRVINATNPTSDGNESPQNNSVAIIKIPPPPQSNSTITFPTPPAPSPPPPGQYNYTQPPVYLLPQMEKDIHSMINQERQINGLNPVDWNDDIESVARLHSDELSAENQPLTEPDLFCPSPFIHHEGFTFGLYENDRLYNHSIYDFSSSGENIFMTSTWDYLETYDYANPLPCPGNGSTEAPEFSGPQAATDVQVMLSDKLAYVQTAKKVNWSYSDWLTQDQLESIIVQGWMASPGHRANILNPNFNQEGIGIAKVNNFIIVTEDFIQKVDCGYLNAPCCQANATAEYCYAPWGCQEGYCR